MLLGLPRTACRDFGRRNLRFGLVQQYSVCTCICGRSALPLNVAVATNVQEGRVRCGHPCWCFTLCAAFRTGSRRADCGPGTLDTSAAGGGKGVAEGFSFCALYGRVRWVAELLETPKPTRSWAEWLAARAGHRLGLGVPPLLPPAVVPQQGVMATKVLHLWLRLQHCGVLSMHPKPPCWHSWSKKAVLLGSP
jgi:hypothetical protein